MEQTFGNFLKTKRLEASLTQKELGEKLFVSESAVCKWEKDIAHPDITLLPKLSEILGVSEHELITASVDEAEREKTRKAKKWECFSGAWEWFFAIAYGLTLLITFICNLSVRGRLDWFWTVFFSLLLAASFTSFPKYIKRYRLVLIPLSNLTALACLFLRLNVFTGGEWFWLAFLPTLVGVLIVLLPIVFAKYNVPKVLKSHNALCCVISDFLLLFLMLFVIERETDGEWLYKTACPLLGLGLFFSLGLVGILRYTKFRRFIKTGFTFGWIAFTYLFCGYGTNLVLFGSFDGEFMPFRFDFSSWQGDNVSNNVTFILFLAFVGLGVLFILLGLLFGLLLGSKKK